MSEKAPFRYSLRAMMIVIGVIATVLGAVLNAPSGEKVLYCAFGSICGASLAAVTGRDWIDVAIGIIYGFVAGLSFASMLPQVE